MMANSSDYTQGRSTAACVETEARLNMCIRTAGYMNVLMANCQHILNVLLLVSFIDRHPHKTFE